MRKKKQPELPKLPENYRDDLLGKNANRQSKNKVDEPQRKRLEDLGDSL